jgi:ABC-2 type transport system permease protein
MIHTGHHFANEMRLILYIKRRYWFESLLGLLFIVGLFCGLVYSVVSISGKSVSSGDLDSMIVGFVLWLFATGSYNSAANDVAEETRHRTIEHIYVAPISFAGILGVRALLQLLISAALLATGMGIVDYLTAGRMHVNILHVLGTALLAAPALVGVGYTIAGSLLLIKKVQVIHAIMYFVLISLVALPAFPINVFAVLPYSLACAAMKASLTGVTIPGNVYLLIAANSAVYLGLGLLAFSRLERRARRLGVLGHW